MADRLLKDEPSLAGKKVMVFVREFEEGRLYKVPSRPRSREDLLELKRADALLGNLAPEDMKQLSEELKAAGKKATGLEFDILELARAA